jgi:hypothetical protein
LGDAEIDRKGTAKYEPLSSVWERGDGELLEAMPSFYPSINPEWLKTKGARLKGRAVE